MILAIDPGTWQSGWVLYDPTQKTVDAHGIDANLHVIAGLRTNQFPGITHVVIEAFSCYGMPIGKTSIQTIMWIGRFQQTVIEHRRIEPALLERREVKVHLCNSCKAKDSNVWQAVMDRYGSAKEVAVGKKAKPGPLYGITSHQRAALALAIAFAEMRR